MAERPGRLSTTSQAKVAAATARRFVYGVAAGLYLSTSLIYPWLENLLRVHVRLTLVQWRQTAFKCFAICANRRWRTSRFQENGGTARWWVFTVGAKYGLRSHSSDTTEDSFGNASLNTGVVSDAK
jgi:hypothetical protein